MIKSTHVVNLSYDRIAQRLLSDLDYETFYVEYGTKRIGNFERLRYLPFGKNVVLGVVSTKDPKMEDVEELMGRVEQATDVIANGQGRSREEVMRDSIGVSPQCGFASMSLGGGVGMTEDKMWEKLVLVWDLARRIWPDTI